MKKWVLKAGERYKERWSHDFQSEVRTWPEDNTPLDVRQYNQKQRGKPQYCSVYKPPPKQ